MATPRVRDLLLRLPKLGAFMSVDMKSGFPFEEHHLLSRKELAYPGTFVKVNDEGETDFELPVDEAQLSHWVSTFKQMQMDHIPVPVPIGHTTDPEARRGTVVKLSVEPSEHPTRMGQPALFCYIKWASPKYKEQFKDSDVSLYMPHQFTSGVGKRYNRPIRHVAITDYPVVPALSKFSDVADPSMAASFELSFVACDQSEYDDSIDHQGEEMASPVLVQLAEELGIEIPQGGDDASIAEAIKGAFNSPAPGAEEEMGGVGGAGGEGEFPPEGDDLDDEEGAMSETEGLGAGVPAEVYDDEGEGGDGQRRRHDRNYDPAPAMSFDVPISLQKQLIRARKIELSQLSTGSAPKITPAVAKALEAQYCSEKAIGFALSHEMQYPGESGDDFDTVIAALSLNTPIMKVGEKTRHQASPNHGDNGTPSIVKDAEARLAKHNARHRRMG